MQTLNITDGNRARTIADDILVLIKSENSLSIHATGIDAINQTILGIDLAKRILEVEQLFLNIEPAIPKQSIQGAEITTSITFQISCEPTFVDLNLLKPAIKTAI